MEYNLINPMTTEQQINAHDWSLERSTAFDHPQHNYRGKQGNFATLWRGSPEEVLQDILRIKQARVESDLTGKPF